MTNTMAPIAILKTDGVGRVRTPKERQQTLLAEFERSGLSGARFAALAGIKYQTFAGWVARRKRSALAKVSDQTVNPVRWLEAVVTDAQQGAGAQQPLKVNLPGGAWLEIADGRHAGLAAVLVRALDKPC
jgi:hypothetical protein